MSFSNCFGVSDLDSHCSARQLRAHWLQLWQQGRRNAAWDTDTSSAPKHYTFQRPTVQNTPTLGQTPPWDPLDESERREITILPCLHISKLGLCRCRITVGWAVVWASVWHVKIYEWHDTTLVQPLYLWMSRSMATVFWRSLEVATSLAEHRMTTWKQEGEGETWQREGDTLALSETIKESNMRPPDF